MGSFCLVGEMKFYRVQIGIQSPEGVTTTRGILRRFSDFLKLFSELKTKFPKKNLPVAPPKSLLKKKSRTLLEERRASLEDWMEKLLSDIDLSRSAPVAIFLELEESARSSFYDSYQHEVDANSSVGGVVQFQSTSDVSLVAGSSSIASDNDTGYETSELGTPRQVRDNSSELGMENRTSDRDKFSLHTKYSKNENSAMKKDEANAANHNTNKAVLHHVDGMAPVKHKMGSHIRRLSTETVGSDVSSVRASEISNLGVENSLGDNSLELPDGREISRTADILAESDLQFRRDLLVALPPDERNKMNRVLTTMKQRLATAKTDMEDLIARLNQELAVRQYLSTKVKDLEVDLETTKQSSKENLQQAVLIERERFTQTQWDVEELRRKCIEMELELKSEQDERVRMESTKVSIIEENEMLQQELDNAREQIENMNRHHEELELKSKADVKLLVKEVKSLRNYQSELKQELSRSMKEKIEIERVLHKERERWEHSNAANAKLLHECEILRNRLEECSVNFLTEEEDKLIVDTSSTSDTIDLLTTSDNRIGLLLAEAQLLSQDTENAVTAAANNNNCGNTRATDDELRKMLTETFIDNARLRKQVNSVIRCALNAPDKSENDDDEEEVPSRKTVLSKFLER
ncbi:PX domain-containing protein EREX-like isoform X2 [Actinidia eriantha]|uniref:PX domain-containing protein EREX-like isoform X2 n=1 Tax=Actinidia eriantha TaxID=165200 RepID=UPI00258B43B4|nr:PX domain-containing protein EREX-like isoform X2 [Actinidia eriantha]XP_057514182.1 PX domain-containing protein EREX-like isoform X2 [Actinidia eriantha]XP_057514183.1 PX domain-containing protein EREX-like isoform X2 [Actinidia eriantha]